jgi:hypothetical protein
MITPAPLAQTQTGRAYRRASRRHPTLSPYHFKGATDPVRVNHDRDGRRSGASGDSLARSGTAGRQARDGNRRPTLLEAPVSASYRRHASMDRNLGKDENSDINSPFGEST